ncbi:MAG: carboxypeptidase regulatory-like domain-containing protein [Chloracidobacterium sp.]|nr:carboxypeptidase regulatory-like domain-containing protein [Chloracidobacterium sp.]
MNIPTLRNQQVTVPIYSDLLTGRNALGYVTTITYDSSKLGYNGLDSTGTLSSGLSFTVDNSMPGTLQIFAFGAVPMSGSGVMVNLLFQANGTIDAVPTPITFTSYSFNEGNPCSTTTDGSVKIISGDISGRVTFALNGANGVPNVAMNATGTSPAVTTNTNYAGLPGTWGNYTLTGFGSGPYTVTPAKAMQPAQSGPTINGITPSDSACIAQWGVGQTCVTTASPTTSVPAPGSARFRAADVTKNGTLSPLDAAYIAQFSVNTPNPGFAGTWEFINPSTSYTQAQIETGVSGQDYTAILLGDVTGNWNPAIAGGNRPAPVDPESQKDAVTAAAGDLQAAPGAPVTVPVSIRNLAGRGVTAYQFDVIYDPRVLETLETAAGLSGTVSDGMSVVFNSTEPGRLRVAVYGATSVAGDGNLIDLHFRAIGAVGTASTLSIDSLVLNEGGIGILTRDGQVRVATAEQGTIRGNLLTATGQGVVNARVNLTSTTGEKRSVLSSSFGGFEFGGLTTGETYTVTVNSKRFTFSPRTVSVVDAVTTLDIIAEQ